MMIVTAAGGLMVSCYRLFAEYLPNDVLPGETSVGWRVVDSIGHVLWGSGYLLLSSYFTERSLTFKYGFMIQGEEQ